MLQEKNQNGLVYYQSDVFSKGIVHGFSTRLGGVSDGDYTSCNLVSSRGDKVESVLENYRRFHEAVGSSATEFARNAQVHGDVIRLVEYGESMAVFCDKNSSFPPADGLMTRGKSVALWVYSADCVPILFYDPVEKAIAAVHAGWRGTASGIAKKTVEAMSRSFGSKAENLEVALGPSIGLCCFICRDDVKNAMESAVGSEVTGFIAPVLEGDEQKFSIDLQGINGLFLRKAGVKKISQEVPCTSCHPDLFWSHRKVGEKRGSMGGMISLEGGC